MDNEYQSKAFDVGDEIEPDDNEPLTGEEYLRRVKWQSNRCPAVVVANIDYSKIKTTIPSNSYFKLPPTITKCKKEYLPTETWEKDFLNDFSEFRQKLQYIKSNKQPTTQQQQQLPHINDKRYWYIFCFGSMVNTSSKSDNDEKMKEHDDDSNDDSDSSDDSDTDYTTKTTIIGNKPTMDILCRMDHITTVTLLNYHIEWLEKREFNQDRSYWLYLLLSSLEKPVDPDTCSNLRSCLRRLAVFRSKITSLSDSNLPLLNILFTIIGKYFDQLEPTDILYL